LRFVLFNDISLTYQKKKKAISSTYTTRRIEE